MSWQSWFKNLWRSRESPPNGVVRDRDAQSTKDLVASGGAAMATGKYQLRVGVVSTVGNVREHNEDNFYVPGRPSLKHDTPKPAVANPRRHDPHFNPASTVDFPAADLLAGPQGLFIVADGMGGQLAGEKASQMAVEMIPVEVARRLNPAASEAETQRALRDAVARANDEILALSHVGTEYANMGTTVVLAQFKDDRAYVAGIGDSRAYRLRNAKIEQLTRDHSLANALGEAGTIRPEEVENHKFKHVLYLYLGSRDARDGPEDVKVIDVQAGDQFLLASDGLMGVVRDELIAEILLANPDPQLAAQTLVNRALELRSKDNITAVVIHLV